MPDARLEAPLAPSRVGRYELLFPIAKGGMGTVYLARRRGVGGFEREVALKLTHTDLGGEADWKLELIEEAKLAARIRHPNVVPVLDVDEDPRGVFLVMEYVEGDTLSGLLRTAKERSTTVPLPLLLRILCDALAGLHAAHELRDASGALVSLVHRDFSPQNILVGVDGVTRLADFGVAKASTRAASTQSGAVKGKFGYMSPEQVRGAALDRRADVWAAGVVAWELCRGERLYPPEDATATLLRITTGTPRRLREARPDLPAALDDALAWALSPDRERRCPTAAELRQRIVDVVRDLGGMPDMAEVARLVEGLAGDKLAERRRNVAEAEQHLRDAPRERQEAPTESAVVRPAGPPRRKGVWLIALGLVAVVAVVAVVRLRQLTSHRSPPSSATTLTDLPLPTSSNPEAVAEYKSALQAQRDGVADTVVRHLERAVTLDPNLAPAQLRLSLMVFTQDAIEGRARFQRAFELRFTLEPHDRTLLDAAEPYIRREPSDMGEFETRVRAALERFPGDAELALWAARLHFLRTDDTGTADYDRALALDPDYGSAYALKAEAQAYMGDLAGALATSVRCVDRLPNATECMSMLCYIEREEGACSRLETDARRLIAVDTESEHGYRALAEAAYALGQPLDAVREALAHGHVGLGEREQRMSPLRERAALAELAGDFASAERALRDLNDLVEPSTSRPEHAEVAQELVLVLREAGRDSEAANVAGTFLDRQRAWVADPRSEDYAIALDATPVMLNALLRAGRLSPETYASRRAAWAAEWRTRALPRFLPYVWSGGYAATVETPDDARAALAEFASYGGVVPHFSSLSLVLADIGRAQLLAGQVDDALPMLRRAAASCRAVEFPIAHTHAVLNLASALEQKGDAAGACEAYRRVRGRWGHAEPRSVSAELALAHMKSLGCAP